MSYRKVCKECTAYIAVASKRCHCGYVFPKASKTIESRMPKGKTNITEQRKQMEVKQAVLHRDHGWHSLILLGKRTASGYLFDALPTNGWSKEQFQEQSSILCQGFQTLFKTAFPLSASQERPPSVSQPINETDNPLKPSAEFQQTRTSEIHQEEELNAEINQQEESNGSRALSFKPLKSISQRDVLPIYPDAADLENGKFWLFWVTSQKPKGKNGVVRGRYFRLHESGANGDIYRLTDQTFVVEAKSIIRFDSEADDFIVLPHFDLVYSEDYFVPRRVVEICGREVDNLLR